MRTHSNRALAKALGVSEAAVRKAEGAGRIARDPDGHWTLESVQRDWQQNSGNRTAGPASLRPVPEATIASVRQTLDSPSSGVMTFLQARTANEVLKAQERKLRLARLKGELVERARAVTLLFRLGRQERDAWAQWPTRVAATLAAELNIPPHTMQTALERLVREHLNELADLQADL